jgi:preprotein translocase subunit SecB
MLGLQLSPLQLEGYYVREFHFAVRNALDEAAQFAMQKGLHMQGTALFNPDTITFNITAGGGQNPEDPLRWASIVELSSNNAPEIRFPYDFQIVLVGFFKLNLNEPTEITEDIEKSLKINATSILYSAAREFIAGVTGRGPFPAAILPSVVIGLAESEQGEQAPTTDKALKSRKSSSKKAAKKGTSKKKRR